MNNNDGQYVLGYYADNGEYVPVISMDSINTLWLVKKRLEARPPQTKFEIKKRG